MPTPTRTRSYMPYVRDPRVDPTNFQIVSHTLLLVAAFFVLQFPQFLSGSQSTAIIAMLYVISYLSWPRSRWLLGPFAAFVGFAALSASWSEHPESALNNALQLAVVVASGVAVGTALPLQRVIVVVVRTALTIGALSLVLSVVAPSIAIHSGPAYAGTLQGIYISKNSLAVVIILGAIASLFRRWPTRREKWEFTLSWIVFLLVLIRTDSATADAILIVAVVFCLMYRWWVKATRSSRATVFALIIAPVVLLVASSRYIYTGTLLILGRDITLTGRTAIWEAAITAWQQKPWLGVGWGSFATDSSVAEAQVALYGWVRDHAHNGYVQVLTELGVVGALLLLITLIVVLVRVVATMRETQALGAGLPMALLLVFIAHNFAEQSMRLLPMFALALAWATATRLRAADGH